jgi:hypothetical protein
MQSAQSEIAALKEQILAEKARTAAAEARNKKLELKVESITSVLTRLGLDAPGDEGVGQGAL